MQPQKKPQYLIFSDTCYTIILTNLSAILSPLSIPLLLSTLSSVVIFFLFGRLISQVLLSNPMQALLFGRC